MTNIDFQKQELESRNFLQDIKNNKSEPQQKLRESQSKLEQTQQEVEQARLELNQVMKELEKLKLQRQKISEDLRKTLITSPIDGTIFNLKAKVGDVIEANADVLVMGDTVEKVVELKLSPLDATKVKVRQQAEITIIGFQSQKLTGKVEQISLLAGDYQNENQGTENVKVTAIVRLDKNNENILAGTPVTVALIISQRDNVLVIPSEAIQQNESQTFVWMRDKESKAFQKIITTGLEGLENIEVKSGLKPGDEILIPFWETPLNVGDNVVIQIQ